MYSFGVRNCNRDEHYLRVCSFVGYATTCEIRQYVLLQHIHLCVREVKRTDQGHWDHDRAAASRYLLKLLTPPSRQVESSSNLQSVSDQSAIENERNSLSISRKEAGGSEGEWRKEKKQILVWHAFTFKIEKNGKQQKGKVHWTQNRTRQLPPIFSSDGEKKEDFLFLFHLFHSPSPPPSHFSSCADRLLVTLPLTSDHSIPGVNAFFEHASTFYFPSPSPSSSIVSPF